MRGRGKMGKRIFKPSAMLNPVPVVMLSCGTMKDSNIITVAWAGTVCSEPPMVSVSIRKERLSHKIISETSEFVINLVGESLARECDYCGVKSGRDIDKFEQLSLSKLESEEVKCPGIEQSPVRIECRVKSVTELGTHDMFVAEVVSVTVDDAYIDESDKFNMDKTNLICYSHGEYYSLGKMLGFFGYSVAAPEVLKRRMR